MAAPDRVLVGLDDGDDAAAVPVIDGARAALCDGFVSGGSRRNLDRVRPHLRFGSGVTEDDVLLPADAQTSGGLLIVGEIPGYPVIGHSVTGAESRCDEHRRDEAERSDAEVVAI